MDAGPKGDENPHSSGGAETMKLLANSFDLYPFSDRSQSTVTKYVNDDEAHKDINSRFSKKFNHLNDKLCEIESVKADVEHNKTHHVGIFYPTVCKTPNA